APLPCAICAVASVEPPSTTIRSSQNASVSRQSAMLPASFRAMMIALSRGMLASRPPVGVGPPNPAPGIAHDAERQRKVVLSHDFPALGPGNAHALAGRNVPA